MTVLVVIATLCPTAAPPASALPRGTTVRVYKGNLNFPVDLAWVPGTGKIFFTEKNSGKIRVLVGGRLRATCRDLAVNSAGERGALGLALHPNYRRNHYLYVYYTNASPLENRVTRFKVIDNRCRRAKHIVRGLRTTATNHVGGQIEFVGGKLFVATGDNGDPANSQRLTNRLGKILRYNPDGTIPGDNPRAGSPIWSYGHRNPFGLAHKPGTGWLFETENGPNCDDELNRIRKGRNYGWGPDYDCGTAGVGLNPRPPLRRWTPVIAPTDAWWYRGRMRALSGSLYFGDYIHGRLHRIVLNSTGTRVRRHRVIFDSSQSIIDVTKGPGGWLYFATPTAIYRIVPR